MLNPTPRARKKTAAAYKPVSLQSCKDHLRITYTDAAQDALISGYLAAAVDELEQVTQRTLVETTWVSTFNAFPGALQMKYDPLPVLPASISATVQVVRGGPQGLKLRMGPVLSIVSVKYLDTNGVQQTMASSDYQADLVSVPAVLYPAAGKSWPATQAGAYNAVEVEYTAGYLAAPANEAAAIAAVPDALRAALLIRVGTLFSNRDQVAFGGIFAEVPTLSALVEPYIVREV